MLTVDYTRKMGEVRITQEQDGKEVPYTIGIYSCNALAAFIYMYKNDKGETICQLMNFLSDKQHVKNLLKEKHELFLGRIKEISLNLWYHESEGVLRYFTCMGYKVNAYFEPLKQKGE